MSRSSGGCGDAASAQDEPSREGWAHQKRSTVRRCVNGYFSVRRLSHPTRFASQVNREGASTNGDLRGPAYDHPRLVPLPSRSPSAELQRFSGYPLRQHVPTRPDQAIPAERLDRRDRTPSPLIGPFAWATARCLSPLLTAPDLAASHSTRT